MAPDTDRATVTFSSPSMRARVYLVRGLSVVDDLERAWAARDYWRARELAKLAMADLALAERAFSEAWGHTDTLEAAEPQDPAERLAVWEYEVSVEEREAEVSESEERVLDGNR